MARLSRLLRPLLLGGAGRIRSAPVRERAVPPRMLRADRCRPLRRGDLARAAPPPARRCAPQGGDAALRAAGGAAAVGGSRSVSRELPVAAATSTGRRP